METEISKTKTRNQLADEYGITTRTLRRWIRKYDIELPAGLIRPKYQKLVYDKLGPPMIKEIIKN